MNVANIKEKLEDFGETVVRYATPEVMTIHDKPGMPSELQMRVQRSAGYLLDAHLELEEVLSNLIEPRYWIENGQLIRQTVSFEPASREDIISISASMDKRLHELQARDKGVCPIRRRLYSDVFNELIRQIIINCKERGLLLLRVRDELNLTLGAFEVLFGSSVDFGMFKADEAHAERVSLQKRVEKLEIHNGALKAIVAELKIQQESANRKFRECQLIRERRFKEELHFYKRINNQLERQLMEILRPKPKMVFN